jgi:hypothetical protein
MKEVVWCFLCVNWRKELSILAESGPGPDNFKLNVKKRKIFQKYKATDPKEIAQLIENLKQKIQAKAQRIRRYERRKNQYIQNKLFKKTQSNSTDIWEQKLLRSKTSHIWRKLSLTGSHYEKRK